MDISTVTAVADTPAERQPVAAGEGAEHAGSEFLGLLESILSSSYDGGGSAPGPGKQPGMTEEHPFQEENKSKPPTLCVLGIGLPLQGGLISVAQEGTEGMNPPVSVAEADGTDQNSLFGTTKSLTGTENGPEDFVIDIPEADGGETVVNRGGEGKETGEVTTGNKVPPESGLEAKSFGDALPGRDGVMERPTARDYNPGTNKDEASGAKMAGPDGTVNNPRQQRGSQGIRPAGRQDTQRQPSTDPGKVQTEPMPVEVTGGRDYRSQGLQPGKDIPETTATEIINQIADRMKVMLGHRKSEVSIQLKPESLGRLKVSLTVTDGVLNGRIIVQNDETRGLIQSHLMRLQESLEGQGVPVGEFQVDVGGGYNHGHFFNQNRQSSHSGQNYDAYQEKEGTEYPVWRGEGTIELLA